MARVSKEIPFHVRNLRFHSLTASPDGIRVAERAFDWDTGKWYLSVFDIASGKSLFTTNDSSLTYSPDLVAAFRIGVRRLANNRERMSFMFDHEEILATIAKSKRRQAA
jgi:hypothetical protein